MKHKPLEMYRVSRVPLQIGMQWEIGNVVKQKTEYIAHGKGEKTALDSFKCDQQYAILEIIWKLQRTHACTRGGHVQKHQSSPLPAIIPSAGHCGRLV